MKYEDIPLRDAFRYSGPGPTLNSHPGCRRLRDALSSTGWRLDSQLFVSEPESNVIGSCRTRPTG